MKGNIQISAKGQKERVESYNSFLGLCRILLRLLKANNTRIIIFPTIKTK